MNSKKKILVTGGNGFVGQNLRKYLEEYNAYFVNSVDYDLTNAEDVYSLFCKHEPEIVIHLAANVGGIKYNTENQYKLLFDNAIMAMNIFREVEDIRRSELKNIRIISCLSTCIYPEKMPDYCYPMKEECIEEGPPQPSNYGYAVGKRLLYSLTKIANESGAKHTCLIPSNLYGPKDNFSFDKGHFVSCLVSKIYEANLAFKKTGEKQVIPMFGDGTPLRQFTYVDDFCLAIMNAVEQKKPGFYNVATPENLSVREIAETANGLLGGKHISFDFSVDKSLSGQYRKDVTSDKFDTEFGKLAYTPLSEGLVRTYKWYSNFENRTHA